MNLKLKVLLGLIALSILVGIGWALLQLLKMVQYIIMP